LQIDQSYKENELLMQVSQGDEKAFSTLVRNYSGQVYGFLLKLLPGSYLVDEIANDIFLHMWLRREKLPEIRNLETYLYVISRNHALNVIKKSLRDQKRLKMYIHDDILTETNTLKDKALDLVEEALIHLSAQQRNCWALSRRKGKSYKEIEEILGITRNTVKSHIMAANASIIKYVLSQIDTQLPEFLIFYFFLK